MNKQCFGAVSILQGEDFGARVSSKSYDLAIATLSWETRATHAFLTQEIDCQTVIALWFESPTDEIDERKESQFGELASKVDRIDEFRLSASVLIEENYQKLGAKIEEEYSKAGRPLKILIDISCIPKNYLLFLLGLGFTSDFFACFDCVYSSGVYDLVADDRDAGIDGTAVHRSLISEGDWKPRQVPFLAAKNVFPKTRDILVSVGGELGLSVPFIERAEPRHLILTFIEESAPGDGREMLTSERLAFDNLMAEPNVTREDIPLYDVARLAALCEDLAKSSDAEGVTLMAIGAKSHALALGLAAMANDNLDVVCRIPARYKAIDVPPSGNIYFYEIEDRFEPSNYVF